MGTAALSLGGGQCVTERRVSALPEGIAGCPYTLVSLCLGRKAAPCKRTALVPLSVSQLLFDMELLLRNKILS